MCHGKDLCGQVPAFFLSGDPLVNGPHSSDARLAQRWHCGTRGLHSKRSLLWKKCGVWGRKCTLHSSSCVLNVYFQSTMTKIDINAGSAGAKCKCVWFMSIFLFLFSSKTCVWVNVIIVCSPWRILDFKKNSCICCESSWVKTLRFLKVINHKWCLHGPPPGCVSRRTGTSRIVLQPHTRLSIKHPWTQHKGGGLKGHFIGLFGAMFSDSSSDSCTTSSCCMAKDGPRSHVLFERTTGCWWHGQGPSVFWDVFHLAAAVAVSCVISTCRIHPHLSSGPERLGQLVLMDCVRFSNLQTSGPCL